VTQRLIETRRLFIQSI